MTNSHNLGKGEYNLQSEFSNIMQSIQEKGVSLNEVASHLGLNYLGLYRRLRGLTEWKLIEAVLLCQFLGCDDLIWLFQFDSN